MKLINAIFHYYRLFEIRVDRSGILPSPPTDKEKYSYISTNRFVFITISIFSFTALNFSTYNFVSSNWLLWPVAFYIILTVIYFLVSLISNAFSKGFDIDKHEEVVDKWAHKLNASVDIFLPI